MTIQYVYNRGDITSTVTSGNSWVGGIIGAQYTNSTLSESYSAGAVIARTNSYIGGLLGGVSGTTYEERVIMISSVMDAQLLPSGYRVPASAIINKLETDNLKKLYKNELIGLNPLTTTELNPDVWEFVETKDLEAHYPQLKVFSQHYNDYVKDSKVSVQTFVFVGEGTSGSPYVITSKDDMDSLSALVQRGITFEGAYFKVKDDIDTIDLTYGKPYVSIGTPEYPFEGYFDGYGTNFILNLSNELDSQGLFGVVGEHGVIRNLSVSGSIHARNQVGSIVGTNFGLVEHVYATTTIDGTTNVGGLIGQNFGTLRYGYHIGEVIGDSVVGGIVGKNEDTILETYAASYIFGRTMIGGVVGYSDGDETLSYYNSAKVDVKTHDTLIKPAKAVGNKEDLETLMGIPTNKLHSTKTLFTSTNWVYENKTGFYAFYPQLKNFATSAYKAIKDASKESVKVSIFNEGDGNEGNPYIIRNAYDMQAMYQMTQNGYSLLNLYFRVAEDVTEIDLTILEEVYIPVGNQNTTFQGNFDGNGVVFNLNVNRNSNYQGLFGVIGSYGVVKNVGVKGSYVDHDSQVVLPVETMV